MSDRFITVALYHPRGTSLTGARISVTTDPADTLTNWRRRYSDAIVPVIIYRTDADLDFIADIAPSGLHTVESAASRLHNLPIDSRYRQLVISSIQQTGSLGVALLAEWFRAVNANA